MTLSADQNRLMEQLRTRLPGAIDGSLKEELFDVVAEFLNHTSMWREDITVAVAAPTVSYPLTPTAGRIRRILDVATEDGISVHTDNRQPDTLRLASEAPDSENYVATVALVPVAAPNGDGLPVTASWIWEHYWETFLDGVLGRMMSQIAKPYSSERMAIYHMRRFRNSMAIARVEALHGYRSNGQRWRYPAFAG